MKCISCFWASAAILQTVGFYSPCSGMQHFYVLFAFFGGHPCALVHPNVQILLFRVLYPNSVQMYTALIVAL